jgi:hypothetical protein
MAILRYVDTASTAGGDGTTNATSGANRAYSTLDAALLEWEGTTLTDVVTIECAAGGGAADGQAQVSGTITTSATNYMHIKAAAGHEALLTGWSTSRYRVTAASGSTLDFTSGPLHCLIEGLQVETAPTAANGGRRAISVGNVAGTAKFLTMDRCRVRVTSSGTGTDIIGVQYQNAGGRLRLVNTISELSGTNTANVTAVSVRTDVASTSVLYNCTVYGAGVGVSYSGTALKAINTLTSACTDGWSSTTYRTGTDYNASSVASDAPGANSRNAQTFTFENAGSGDYRLAAGDAGARTFGANLSADGDYAFSIDMASTARSAPWDIGAHEVSISAASSIAAISSGYHNRGLR